MNTVHQEQERGHDIEGNGTFAWKWMEDIQYQDKPNKPEAIFASMSSAFIVIPSQIIGS
ncbi:hypothetical protein JCM19235_7019 [Vibrio maritimus]|uniref:Uncharacterized protein n=1 Tax=Vibrio maritimus TaxID=990268 RepID=A0A090S987_9VIBR|nr:hypothetical protein JCM19235_7019 [Vibrio maritimus]